MNANSSLHQRIANALGWPLADVQSMSLRSLRELVRPIDPQLGEDISFYSGAVLTVAHPRCGNGCNRYSAKYYSMPVCGRLPLQRWRAGVTTTTHSRTC